MTTAKGIQKERGAGRNLRESREKAMPGGAAGGRDPWESRENAIQRGRGKGRDPWAIRRYLSGLDLTMTAVARKARTPLPVVSDTLRGVRNHARVLAVLEALGCPKELLYPRESARGEA